MFNVPEPTALIELSIFDALSASVTFGTAWLVEGDIDVQVLEQALARVVDKWRLFAGRLHKELKNDAWFVKIPLGTLPADYPTYSLTRSESDRPLSSYLPLPLQTSSPILEPNLYMPSFLPTSNEEYERLSHPLASFHVVTFPAETTTSARYGCIGLTLPHGFVDGVGAAYLCKGLVSELEGTEWEVPPLPLRGLQRSSMHAILQSESFIRPIDPPQIEPDKVQTSKGMDTKTDAVTERKGRILIISPNVFALLVEEVRAQSSSPYHISSGDVLSAWIIKMLYEDDPLTNKSVMIQSLASFRHLFASFPKVNLSHSPHNYLALLPIPPLPVALIRKAKLAELTQIFAQARNAFCEYDVSVFFKQLTGILPFMEGEDEGVVPLVISNASNWRLIEIDWSKVGAIKTICGYRMLHEYEKVGKDAVQMIGRLRNGSIVLDTILSAEAIGKLEERIVELEEKYKVSPSKSRLDVGL
ncbi:hypothetical protein GYMLUDRAFT_180180 [Collybiopsis luxurians FD-317 M1]|uniref:Diacylglycerol O-acyltransferase n=1 Tax=Collybiopsis luxurians FD-317 M1 TaxID=944289 RepID=A0A0D0CBR3_9AGAR|nr:hypothetical protein GYMLUDRAFT_180180 [Collybiopsis luxurians FD-317 M1]